MLTNGLADEGSRCIARKYFAALEGDRSACNKTVSQPILEASPALPLPSG